MHLLASITTTTYHIFSELSQQEAWKAKEQEDQASKTTIKAQQATSWTHISYRNT